MNSGVAPNFSSNVHDLLGLSDLCSLLQLFLTACYGLRGLLGLGRLGLVFRAFRGLGRLIGRFSFRESVLELCALGGLAH